MLICDEYLTPASLDEAFDAMAAPSRPVSHRRRRHRHLPWAREGRAGDVEIPVLIDVAKIPELQRAPRRRHARAPRRRHADPALPRRCRAGARAARHAALRGVVRRRPDPRVRHHRRQHRQRLAGRRRHAAADRARGARWSWRPGATARSCGARLPLDEFVTGPGKTALEEDELLVAIECDALPGYGGSFEKVGHRRSLVISLVCLAALVKLDAAGRAFEDVRLAIGGIGPVPRVSPKSRPSCAPAR